MLRALEAGLEAEFLPLSQYEVPPRAECGQPFHALPWQRQELP